MGVLSLLMQTIKEAALSALQIMDEDLINLPFFWYDHLYNAFLASCNLLDNPKEIREILEQFRSGREDT